MFFQLACNMVKKCLQIGYCAVSEVKMETLFLLEIQQWSDNFPPSERSTSRTGFKDIFGPCFLMTCASESNHYYLSLGT